MIFDGDSSTLDFDRLLKLRLAVGRFGEMDAAKWWNTQGLLGAKGALLMRRGFAKTHYFAQARVVLAVANARSAEVFDPPESMTLWKLPANIEDQFDARWSGWLDNREQWAEFFEAIKSPGEDLLTWLEDLELIESRHRDIISGMRRSAEGRAVPLSGFFTPNDDVITLLAAGHSRGEPGKLAVPYARLEAG